MLRTVAKGVLTMGTGYEEHKNGKLLTAQYASRSYSNAEGKEFMREYSSYYVVSGMARFLEHFGRKLDASMKGINSK